MKSIALVLSFATFSSGQHLFDDVAEDLTDCACQAEQLGFEIQCHNQVTMTQAWSVLLTNNCHDNCDSQLCRENYAFVQTHHDYCFHDEMPTMIETEFHDFEAACGQHNCKIFRKPEPGKQNCPDPVCSSGGDGAGNVAYAAMILDNCLDDCSKDKCAANFAILRAEHDLCLGPVLAEHVEDGFHTLEDACAAQTCNVWHEDYGDLSQCEHARVATWRSGSGDDSLSGGAIFGILVAVVVGLGLVVWIVVRCSRRGRPQHSQSHFTQFPTKSEKPETERPDGQGDGVFIA